MPALIILLSRSLVERGEAGFAATLDHLKELATQLGPELKQLELSVPGIVGKKPGWIWRGKPCSDAEDRKCSSKLR